MQNQDKVLEARKYRIYPDEEQVKYLNHNIFANIKMWNALLAKVYEPIMELDEIQELHAASVVRQCTSILTKCLMKTVKSYSSP